MSDARSEERVVERVWYGAGAGERAARLALLPLEALYAGVSAARGALYDAGLLRASETAVPALAVGNLTVGGTGKTPVAAWLAAELRARGARPAIVLRGYGADEPLVHETLNPDVPVVVAADRVLGAGRARVLGADVVVLDDAFQHRRARRVADVVLLSADRWTPRRRHLLPAGPWREPLAALRRASLALVTRKAVTLAHAEAVLAAATAAAPGVHGGVALLAPGDLVPAPVAGGDAGERPAPRPLASIDGARVLAISAIGDGGAFHAQLVAAGARLEPPPAAYPDHHAFTDAEVARLARDAERAEIVVCTLKDAVKLAPRWPRAGPPLWYVSQRVVLERGREAVDRLLETVLAARDRAVSPAHDAFSPKTAGARRPTDLPDAD
ncbi:MAG: tetraacyldisaccharide 4'-kinase [Gemmatimonadaceae bacterium]